MALLYVEKFAKYSDDQHVDDDNTAITAGGTTRTMETGTGRFGDTTLQMAGATTHFQFPWAALTASETIIVAFSVREFNTSVTNVDNQNLCALTDPSDQVHWRIDLIPGGLNLFRAGGGAPVLVATALNCIGVARWHWIEIKATMQTSGSVEVKVDGVTVINVTATDFRDGASDTLTGFRMYGSRYFRQYDEIIICDDTGATFNTFFGDMRIAQAVPDADGSVVDWTASAGTDVSCVDDALAAYDDDTTYIESSTTDQESLFSHAAFTLTGVNVVKFVQLSTLARDDGTNTLRQLVRSGGTTYDSGSDLNPTTDYQWFNHMRELDPNGTIAWTEANINSAEFGVRARP